MLWAIKVDRFYELRLIKVWNWSMSKFPRYISFNDVRIFRFFRYVSGSSTNFSILKTAYESSSNMLSNLLIQFWVFSSFNPKIQKRVFGCFSHVFFLFFSCENIIFNFDWHHYKARPKCFINHQVFSL